MRVIKINCDICKSDIQVDNKTGRRYGLVLTQELPKVALGALVSGLSIDICYNCAAKLTGNDEMDLITIVDATIKTRSEHAEGRNNP